MIEGSAAAVYFLPGGLAVALVVAPQALWQAKVALREAGHPVRDWAGWVLTGDPD